MKTIFDEATQAELLERLERLNSASERQWGKMTPSQMMEHTARGLEMAVSPEPGKQMMIGKLIGWAFKGGFLSDKPMPKNAPTGPMLVVSDDPDLEATRARLGGLINDLHKLGESGTEGKIHSFFGPLTGKQWGETQYKHVDHHLRQFGV